MHPLILGAVLVALAALGSAARAADGGEPSAAAEMPAVQADEPLAGPQPILPGRLTWTAPPELPGLQAVWLLGSEKDAGLYVLRVKLAAESRVGVHVHGDDRVTSVLAGTLYVGFGSIFDETRMQAVPAGAIYLAPADQPHYLWAKDGEVEYQESGNGPSSTRFGLP